MGFSPVATLADKQSFRLFGPTDKLLRNFLPISNPILTKKAVQNKFELHFLELEMGFEPTAY